MNTSQVIDCLSPETIILFNNKALKKFGGYSGGVKDRDAIENLSQYVSFAGGRYGFDEIEKIVLAVYQIVKNHLFWDGNKRTSGYVLINCLRKSGYGYTGRPIDLAREIERLAASEDKKRNVIGSFTYFLKRHLQKY